MIVRYPLFIILIIQLFFVKGVISGSLPFEVDPLHLPSTTKSEVRRPQSTPSSTPPKSSPLPDPYPVKPDHDAGLDFLNRWKGTGPILSHKYYLDKDMSQFENRSDVLQLVQQFIREIKGVRLRKSPTTMPLLIRPGARVKVAWCHHPYMLRELVKLELQLYQVFANFYLYKKNKGISLMVLDSWLVDIERTTIRSLNAMIGKYSDEYGNQDPAKDIFVYIASHPLLVYRMIRRFAEDFGPILMQITAVNHNLLSLAREVSDAAIPKYVVLPDAEDLYYALDSLRRVQQGYILDTHAMSVGTFDKVKTGIKMTAMNCLELGTFLYENSVLDLSVEWLQLAVDKIQNSNAAKDLPEIEQFAEKLLKLAVADHNSKFPELGSIEPWNNWEQTLFENPIRLPFNRSDYARWNEMKGKKHDPLARKKSSQVYFNLVCSGANFQTTEEKSRLSCWYERSSHPYWYIGPLKFELLNEDPAVHQVYDFFGDKLMMQMKRTAHLNLEQSGVSIGDGSGGGALSPVRTSTEAHLSDKGKHNFLLPLTKRLEMLSGYRIYPESAASNYLVACYSSSHHYDPHMDPLSDCPRVKMDGNRIATFMGYLSDVRVGGRTGFPLLGFSVEPVMGSLVFWHNMKRNGENDQRMLHGGCPVVLGLKWITNKWVHYNDNFSGYQCTLNHDE